MKALFKGLGILMLICGIVMYLIAGAAQEDTKGSQISFGYIQGDKYYQTGSGIIGSNPEGYETLDSLKTLGIVAGIGGAVFLLMSLSMKED